MEEENTYIKGLNPVQKDAVLYCSGPSLVIAGAGSGKTRVLTHKIAYMISKGVDPHRIMALTFTNKAAKEMKERIDQLLGYNASQALWMGTFHSIFGRILRFEAQHIGFTSSFTIYDTADAKNLLKDIIKDMKLDADKYKPKDMYGLISMMKNRLILPSAYNSNPTLIANDRAAHRPDFAVLYQKYFDTCRKSNVMDFDDLLLYTNILFKKEPEILNKYQQKFDYYLVDEYQDTNFAQYLIVKRLAELHNRLFVVGDDAQSIYSFRGADIQNILNFKNDYPAYKLFKLEQNYRSTQNIVEAANSLIKKNIGQIPKKVFSENEEGDKIQIFQAASDNMEGSVVAQKLQELNTSGTNYSECAILYRTNAQSRILEEALRARNIPYKIYGGLSFYQRKEIKDVIAYLRFALNHNDIEAFKRIINYPSRKIGQTTIDKVLQTVEAVQQPLWAVIKMPEQFPLEVNGPTKLRLREFAMLIDSFAQNIANYDAYNFVVDVFKRSGVESELLNDQTPEGETRRENVQELLNGVKMFCETSQEAGEPFGIANYLENVSILTDLEEVEGEEKDSVSLMTIHSSKGLEFENVIITGVEENLFPGAMTVLNPTDLEEERRLFYVAITRAKKRLLVYYAENRFRFGKLTPMSPSRFLREIDLSFVDWHGQFMNPIFGNFSNDYQGFTRFERKPQYNPQQQSLNEIFKQQPTAPRNLVPIKKAATTQSIQSADSNLLIVGVRIRHKMFGEGVIANRIGSGEDTKLIINFDSGETKTLLLKFAKLQIVE